MTATLVPPFLGYNDMANKNSKVLDYNITVDGPASAPCTSINPPSPATTGSLLDRKVAGTLSMGGLYQRRHSVTLPSSKFQQNQFINSLKMDISAMVGSSSNNNNNNKENRFRDRSFSETGDRFKLSGASCAGSNGNGQVNSSRYKTELCRPFEENGTCKYGDKCQFAHGMHELRSLSRHPKYKTELCRTFHTIGFCPYGPRCHFIHNAEERRGPPPLSVFNKLERPRLHHSYSFAGFTSSSGARERQNSFTPPPMFSTEDLMEWPSNPLPFSNQELTNLFGACLGGSLTSEHPSPLSPTVTRFFRPMSESPSTPPDSLSDQEGYQSSLGSQSGSESPVLDATRRLPIFSRLSISDD